MGQIYPTPTSSGQSLTINTNSPLTGGGVVSLGGNLTIGLSTTNDATRNAYVVTPNPDGVAQNFTIVGASPNLTVSYADVFINGKLQLSSVFSILGNILSLDTAPLSGSQIRVVFSSPNDNRQQFSLTASSSTVFTFPTPPQSTYVDIYDGNGNFQSVGPSGYYLDITNDSYSVVFASAPTTPVIAVFDPSVNSGRQAYPLVSHGGSTTVFDISGGSPSTGYIDVFAGGLFQMDGASYDYTLSYTSGNWIVTFASPPSGVLEAVFAPSTVLPSLQTGGSTVNQIVAGTNVTISPTSGTGIVTVNASGGGSGTVSYGTENQLAYYASNGTTVVGLDPPLSITMGGTGTSSPSLVAGSNVAITGSWPNQTISSSGGSGGYIKGIVNIGPASGAGTYTGSGTISGANVGDVVTVGVSNSTEASFLSNLLGWVSSTNTVTIRATFSSSSLLLSLPVVVFV